MSYRGFIPPSYTFQAFKDLFAPVTNQGNTNFTLQLAIMNCITITPIPVSFSPTSSIPAGVFRKPANGPAGYEHLAIPSPLPAKLLFRDTGSLLLTKDSVPQAWGQHRRPPDGMVKSTGSPDKATHKFIFIHTPYYYVDNDTNRTIHCKPILYQALGFP